MRRSAYDEIERRMGEARHAARKAEQQRRARVRWRAELASIAAPVALIRLGRVLARKYRPDQPRVPAGSPGAGRWTDGSGGLPPAGAQQPHFPVRVILAGGFTKDQLNLTVQDFVAQNCKGQIRRELPGQLLGLSIGEVIDADKSGDPAARKCLKLLKEDRFRK